MRSLEFYVCYYGWGDYKKRDASKCIDSDIYKTIYIVVAVVPYWLRVLQVHCQIQSDLTQSAAIKQTTPNDSMLIILTIVCMNV